MGKHRRALIIALLSLMVFAAEAQDQSGVRNSTIDCLVAMPIDEVMGQTALCGELTEPANWEQRDGR